MKGDSGGLQRETKIPFFEYNDDKQARWKILKGAAWDGWLEYKYETWQWKVHQRR